MEKSIHQGLTIFILFVLIIASCKPEPPPPPQGYKIPTANAGLDIVITLPLDSILLDGSASTARDGNLTKYEWSKISGPATFNITNQAAVRTRVNNLMEGVYQFELKVTNDKGLSAMDTVQVTVNPVVRVNRSPVANAGIDQIINFPVSSTYLDGRSSSDPDNNLATYAWAKIAGPASYNIHTPSTTETLITGLAFGGLYQFELTVTDSMGLYAKDTITVFSNRPPVSNAGSYQLINLPANTVILDGNNSSDPDNNITSYTWTKLYGPLAFNIGNINSAQTQVNNLAEGDYTFSLKVTDAGGLISTSQINVSVDTIIPGNIIMINGLHWTNDCNFSVNNIGSYIPAGQNSKIYVRWIDATGSITSNWVYVRRINTGSTSELFNYEIASGNLIINAQNLDCGFDDAQSYTVGIVLL